MKLTVVIIDHMAVFRQALDTIVQAYGSPEQIIGFPDTATLLHAEDLACDLLLWGNTASHLELLRDLEQVCSIHSNAKVVVLLSTCQADVVEQLVRAGVLGFLRRDEDLSRLLPSALDMVLQGEVYASPQVGKHLLESSQRTRGNPLSVRQMQVVHYMRQHYTPQEIATAMKTSASAVYSLQYRIRDLLQVRTTSQIVSEMIQRGWLKEQT